MENHGFLIAQRLDLALLREGEIQEGGDEYGVSSVENNGWRS